MKTVKLRIFWSFNLVTPVAVQWRASKMFFTLVQDSLES
jgi:hypothetical protein